MTRITVELPNADAMDVIGSLSALGERLGVHTLTYEEGPKPETPREKGIRRLGEARRRFDDAALGFDPMHRMDGTGPRALRDGCSLLSEALTFLGGDL